MAPERSVDTAIPHTFVGQLRNMDRRRPVKVTIDALFDRRSQFPVVAHHRPSEFLINELLNRSWVVACVRYANSTNPSFVAVMKPAAIPLSFSEMVINDNVPLRLKEALQITVQ
jgi:hypothetical protein